LPSALKRTSLVVRATPENANCRKCTDSENISHYGICENCAEIRVRIMQMLVSEVI
jgi:Zn finger protein HypA/HybF involved in hydrogenase expression